jgi:hypothetical protein
MPYDRNVFVERHYYVRLEEVLTSSKQTSQARLVNFVKAAMNHLRQDGLKAVQSA